MPAKILTVKAVSIAKPPDIDQFVIIGSRGPSQVSFRLRPGKQISAECQAAMGD
jgi:hypothetical protein